MAESQHESGAPLWGVSAEFDTADAMLQALQHLRGHQWGRIEAYSPMPMDDAAATLGLHDQPIYPFAVGGAVLGGVAMYGMCAYATMVSYRFNIGGRPFFSWPSFVVPSVSFALLCGALAAAGALFALSRLPRLNHPAFNIPHFTRATENRFFVAVEARGEEFDPAQVEAALGELVMQPRHIHRVPR